MYVSLRVYFYINMMIFYDTNSGLKKKLCSHVDMHYLERVKLLLIAGEAADRLAGSKYACF
jgi:hypothetical protein